MLNSAKLHLAECGGGPGGVPAVRVEEFLEQEITNTLFAFAKVGFLDFGVMEVR